MKNIAISDEEGGIYLYAGMKLAESDIDALEAVLDRLFGKMLKLEKHAPTPEGTRLNILEYSHDTLWKAQAEAKKSLEKMRNKVSDLSGRLNLNSSSHIRIQEAIGKNSSSIDQIAHILASNNKAAITRNKRLSDIEEFLGDL